MKSLPKICLLCVCALLYACNGVPRYVIQPDEMAELMADIRVADAVVAVNRNEFNEEYKQLALRNAVFERHGVTSEQFDTSLIWYGHNMSVYQDVTKKSISILEGRLKQVNALAAGEAAMSVSGDSVDIWDASRFYIFSDRGPSQYVVFEYDTDPNWEQGDVYTLRSRLITPAKYAQWNITAEYDDGAIETITSNVSLDNPARQELTLVTDSTRTATRISGWLNVEPVAARPAIVDSVSLMRRRSSPALARQRKYAQKLYIPQNVEPKEDKDQSEPDTVRRLEAKQPATQRSLSGTVRRIKQ